MKKGSIFNYRQSVKFYKLDFSPITYAFDQFQYVNSMFNLVDNNDSV